MSASNTGKLAPEVVEAIERQRTRLFQAMAFVEVTEMTFGEEEVSQRQTLKAAYKLLDDIAMRLDLVGSYGTDRMGEDERDAA